MNESTPIAPPPIAASANVLEFSAQDIVPIVNASGAIEAILRQPRRVIFHLRQGSNGRVAAALLVCAAAFALVYGFVIGTFSGGAQLWITPLKVAGGLFVSAVICLPSLYIFACLSGSDAKLSQVAGLVAGLLGLTTLLLIGFAPVAWVFSQSTASVGVMGVLHLIFWTVAVAFGWRFLRNGFEHFSARRSGALNVWMVIFVVVCLQMTTALRPLLGTAPTVLPQEKKFFVSHWLDTLGKENGIRE
jgi:hypothetical protein